MATVTLRDKPINTIGDLPKVGSGAKDFELIAKDLSRVSLKNYAGSRLVLNIFPSLDTGTCAASVRRFNQIAGNLPDTKVLCISRDTPFAQSRFCGAEGLDKVIMLSDFRTGQFANNYGVKIIDGPLQGLMSRAVLIIDENSKVLYSQQVEEVSEEPDYESATAFL